MKKIHRRRPRRSSIRLRPRPWVAFPTFEIVSNPTIRLSDIKARRFNIIDRYQSLEKAEDILIGKKYEKKV